MLTSGGELSRDHRSSVHRVVYEFASQNSSQLYFSAMFRILCLQFTNPIKHGLLDLSSYLQGSMSGLLPKNICFCPESTVT